MCSRSIHRSRPFDTTNFVLTRSRRIDCQFACNTHFFLNLLVRSGFPVNTYSNPYCLKRCTHATKHDYQAPHGQADVLIPQCGFPAQRFFPLLSRARSSLHQRRNTVAFTLITCNADCPKRNAAFNNARKNKRRIPEAYLCENYAKRRLRR